MKVLIPILFLLYVSCSNPCIKNLKQDLAKNWKYDSDKRAYIVNHKFLNELDTNYRACLYGKDTTYITKLFGPYYRIDKGGNGMIMLKYGIKSDYAKYAVASFFFELDEKFRCRKINYWLYESTILN